MTPPLVSVVIPTYNYSKYITQAIESVLAQSYANIEIIIIDDGSTDDTASIVRSFGDKVQYHYQANRGLSAARNRGIELSSGTYIQFLDSDDKLGPQSIESKVRCLDRNPDLAFACSPNRFFFEDKGPLYNLLKNLFYGWKLPNQRDVIPTLCYGNLAPPHAFLTRLAAIKANNLQFDESLRACEDYDFWLRLATTCGEPKIIREGLVYYRKHGTSMSSNVSNQLRFDALMVERAHAALCADNSPVHKPQIEYLSANLAATLKTYYQLLRTGQNEYESQLKDHIDRLRIECVGQINCGKLRSTRYRSEMRIIVFKLVRDKILLPRPTMELIEALGQQKLISCWGYILENLKFRSAMPELLNILLLDLQFIYLKLTNFLYR